MPCQLDGVASRLNRLISGIRECRLDVSIGGQDDSEPATIRMFYSQTLNFFILLLRLEKVAVVVCACLVHACSAPFLLVSSSNPCRFFFPVMPNLSHTMPDSDKKVQDQVEAVSSQYPHLLLNTLSLEPFSFDRDPHPAIPPKVPKALGLPFEDYSPSQPWRISRAVQAKPE